MKDFLRSNRIADYLVERHGIPAGEARSWIEDAVAALQAGRGLPDLMEVERGGAEFEQKAKDINRFPVFMRLAGDDLQDIGSRVFRQKVGKGHTFFQAGEYAERMHIIRSGEVLLLDQGANEKHMKTLGENDAFGGMSFLTGGRHAVTAAAITDATVWVFLKQHFDELLRKSHSLEEAVSEFLRQEEISTYLSRQKGFDPGKASRWTKKAIHDMQSGKFIPMVVEIDDIIKSHRDAPLAIWIGIMLDGIPESLVIGASLIHANLSLSLLAGLFLSNYPEAMSSSVGMRQQGMGYPRILLMWTMVMLLTGLGAALGNLFFLEAPAVLFSLVEGLAAGAMLTMIAETMLPEAYLKGGSIIGFATLFGFLCAISLKPLE